MDSTIFMLLSPCFVVMRDRCIHFLTRSENQPSCDLTDLDEVYSRGYAMRCVRRFGDASKLEESVEGFLSGMICFILTTNVARFLLNCFKGQSFKKYMPIIIAMHKIKLIVHVYWHVCKIRFGKCHVETDQL